MVAREDLHLKWQWPEAVSAEECVLSETAANKSSCTMGPSANEPRMNLLPDFEDKQAIVCSADYTNLLLCETHLDDFWLAKFTVVWGQFTLTEALSYTLSLPHIHSVNPYCFKHKVKQGFWGGKLFAWNISLTDVPEIHKSNKIIMEGSFRKHLVRERKGKRHSCVNNSFLLLLFQKS